MGRRSERAATAVTEYELERLRLAARIEGVTVSHLLRRAGLREAEQVLDAHEARPLARRGEEGGGR